MEQVEEQPMEIQAENLRHKHAMEELEYARETDKKKHEMDLETARITNAQFIKRDSIELERQKELILFRKEHWARS